MDYGFETRNRKIAGSTMSKREQAVRSSSANECPAGHLSDEISHHTTKITHILWWGYMTQSGCLVAGAVWGVGYGLFGLRIKRAFM